MNRRKDRLPIIIGHSTKTGIMVFPNRNFGGGRDMVIVGLNKEIQTGQQFEMEDIDWIKVVLHFSDVNALQTTVDMLTKELKRWRKEEES